MLATPISLPRTLPEGYEPLANEPVLDSARHLALEVPQEVLKLKDLGYDEPSVAGVRPSWL
jgi:hypothetical protein